MSYRDGVNCGKFYDHPHGKFCNSNEQNPFLKEEMWGA